MNGMPIHGGIRVATARTGSPMVGGNALAGGVAESEAQSWTGRTALVALGGTGRHGVSVALKFLFEGYFPGVISGFEPFTGDGCKSQSLH